MFSRLVNRLVFWRTPAALAAAKAQKSQSFPKAPVSSSSFLSTFHKKTLVTAIRTTYHIHPMVVDYLCLLYAIGAFAPSDDEQDEKQPIHKSSQPAGDAGIKFRILDRLLFHSRGGLGMTTYQGSPNGSHCTTSFFVPSDSRLLQNQGAPLSSTRHTHAYDCISGDLLIEK